MIYPSECVRVWGIGGMSFGLFGFVRFILYGTIAAATWSFCPKALSLTRAQQVPVLPCRSTTSMSSSSMRCTNDTWWWTLCWVFSGRCCCLLVWLFQMWCRMELQRSCCCKILFMLYFDILSNLSLIQPDSKCWTSGFGCLFGFQHDLPATCSGAITGGGDQPSTRPEAGADVRHLAEGLPASPCGFPHQTSPCPHDMS